MSSVAKCRSESRLGCWKKNDFERTKKNWCHFCRRAQREIENKHKTRRWMAEIFAEMCNLHSGKRKEVYESRNCRYANQKCRKLICFRSNYSCLSYFSAMLAKQRRQISAENDRKCKFSSKYTFFFTILGRFIFFIFFVRGREPFCS